MTETGTERGGLKVIGKGRLLPRMNFPFYNRVGVYELPPLPGLRRLGRDDCSHSTASKLNFGLAEVRKRGPCAS